MFYSKGSKYLHIVFAIMVSIYVAVGWWNQQFYDLVYALVFVGMIWSSLIFYWVIKRYVLQATALLIALVSGVYAYFVSGYTNLNGLYSTVRLFALNTDPLLGPDGEVIREIPASLEVARWAAAIYLISTISLLLFNYFGRSILLFWVKLRGKHVIIIGYNNKSSVFINELRSEKRRVIVVDSELTMEEREYLYERGIAYDVSHYRNEQLYKKCALHKAGYIVLFSYSDAKNLDAYYSIRGMLEAGSRRKVQLLIHLYHAKSRQLFDSMVPNDPDNVKSRPFNMYQLIAEKMLVDEPLYKGYEDQLRDPDGDPLHLLFVGFGKINQQIAYQALHLSHFLNKSPIRITVFDRDIATAKKEWSNFAHDYKEMTEMKFKKVDLYSDQLNAEQVQLSPPITHVFVAVKDDFLDLIEGLELASIVSNVPVFIKMNDELSVSTWLHDHEEEFRQVKKYAYLREVLTGEHILNEQQLALAATAHTNYQKLRVDMNLPPIKEWSKLDNLKRDSTRYQFLHNDTKLMLLGLEKVRLKSEEQTKMGILSKEEYMSHIKSLLQKMAEVEHARWNAFHYLRGWKTLPLERLLADKERDWKKLKLHECLVTWDELDNVSEQTGTDFKQYDREAIEYLYEYNLAQGYGLKK